jgi:hypothetical protein
VRRRLIMLVAALAVAYGVGLMSDWVLNGDPCIEFYADDSDQVDPVQGWLPVRTDCRITNASGAIRVERGSAEVFLSMFALMLVATYALVSRLAVVIRLVLLGAAGVAAFLVIFIY